MDKKEIIKQLHESSNWIYETSNYEESNEPHIKDMLEGIQNAINKLSMDVIEVDISFYHPDDDETKKVYDEEGMREEFENKLKQLI
jgi:myo-inositol catabolism protein IolC